MKSYTVQFRVKQFLNDLKISSLQQILFALKQFFIRV